APGVSRVGKGSVPAKSILRAGIRNAAVGIRTSAGRDASASSEGIAVRGTLGRGGSRLSGGPLRRLTEGLNAGGGASVEAPPVGTIYTAAVGASSTRGGAPASAWLRRPSAGGASAT